MEKKTLLSALVALLALVSVPLPAKASSILYVDDDPGCDGNTPCYSSIQDAVNAASPGDTIIVLPGNYEEEVFIDKDLTLKGEGDPVILAPESLTDRITDDIQPNRDITAIIFVLGDVYVTIEGFIIDGQGNGNGNFFFTGITYFEASGVIKDNEVKDIRNDPLDGVQNGGAIVVTHVWDVFKEHHVVIEDNYVHDYQKTGIIVNEWGTSALIKGNRVEGIGPTDIIGQNGISVGFGATAVVEGNEVSGNWYTGEFWIASGILLFETDGSSVLNNEITGNQAGIAVEDWGLLPYASATENEIVNNEIEDSETGISVGALGWFGDASADDNKVAGNEIREADVGINLFAIPSGFDASGNNILVSRNEINGATIGIIIEGEANSNNINRNEIEASGTGILIDGASDNVIHRNEIEAGTTGMVIKDDSSGNNVHHNEIEAGGDYAVILELGTSNNLIHHNELFAEATGFAGDDAVLDQGMNQVFANS